jgi:hypothetical protein
MQGEQEGRCHDRGERPQVVTIVVVPRRVLTLPAWESFPEQDRHRLVHVLLQAARRQVEVPWSIDGLQRK